MTLPLLLAVELASGGFYVVNPCDSTAVAQSEPLQLDTIQAHKSKIREQYTTFLKTCQISFFSGCEKVRQQYTQFGL
jgi:hypothetical protein